MYRSRQSLRVGAFLLGRPHGHESEPALERADHGKGTFGMPAGSIVGFFGTGDRRCRFSSCTPTVSCGAAQRACLRRSLENLRVIQMRGYIIAARRMSQGRSEAVLGESINRCTFSCADVPRLLTTASTLRLSKASIRSAPGPLGSCSTVMPAASASQYESNQCVVEPPSPQRRFFCPEFVTIVCRDAPDELL